MNHQFTARDFDSETWQKLTELLSTRLQKLREENDSGDAEVTAKRRGRIAELKELLSLDPKSGKNKHSASAE